MSTLYMKVTKDKYELPLAVADSQKELAELLGVKLNVVVSSFCKGYGTFKKVEIDETDSKEFL